jgi:hypothetical protein
MSFFKSKGFKYLKNLIIGVGAAIVLVGALFKIESWPHASELLIAGLLTEAGLFLMLGLLGPDPDVYWDKLYPGISDYNSSNVKPIAAMAGGAAAPETRALDGDVVHNKLGGMLTELQSMSKSLGSLKALQEVDFSGTSDQIKQMSNFYGKMNEAMSHLSDSMEDTKRYKEQMSALNKNLGSLNAVYGGMLSAMSNTGR